MRKKIKNIVVLGGGSAGWLTVALFSSQRNGVDLNVTIIEPIDIPTIGVGESTQPLVTVLLQKAGISKFEWMPGAKATYKLGVLVDGWSEIPAFVDSEDGRYNTLYDNWTMPDYILHNKNKITPTDFNNWLEAFQFAKNNKSPQLGKVQYDISEPLGSWRHTREKYTYQPDLLYYSATQQHPPHAVQWDNYALADTLKEICCKRSNVTLIKDKATEVSITENGYIDEIYLANHSSISGDLYIDCSGFKSVLLDKTYGVPWNSFDKFLLTNRALVVRKKYNNPQQECIPYTLAKAMDAGWRWSIPTSHDISFGYVFSENHITKDQAEKELRESVNEWDAPLLDVPFNPGVREKICHKNVIGAGLSSAFVEPLQATSLAFTCQSIGLLHDVLSTSFNNAGVDTMYLESTLNTIYNNMVTEISSFIHAHYRFSTKPKGQFWNDARNVPLPDIFKEQFNYISNNLLKDSMLKKWYPEPMFAAAHWFELLYPYGVYDNIDHKIPEKINQYGSIWYNRFKTQTDELLNMFPNHYDYLTEWYNSC